MAISRVRETPPLGPEQRRFVNAAVLVRSDLDPPDMLAQLKSIEAAAGRRRGQRWGPRALDCDLLLWSGGVWANAEVTVPHPAFRTRRFVLEPLAEIAPDWRDPLTGLTVRQLRARLDRARPAA